MSRRTVRPLLAGVVALVLALDVAAAYQLGVRAHRAPTFRRGGAFATARPLAADRPLPYTPLRSSSTTAPVAAPPARTSSSTTSTTAVAAAVVAAASPSVTAPEPGTYTYAVDGTESATGFGSRRLPSTMTTTIHADADDAARRVLDLRFSDQHEEREIADYRDGVAFVYEAGSVTFGPYTQTSEADYRPPMVQVPSSLAVGATVSGTTDATSRVEDWTVRVERAERVDDVDTLVVTIHRQSKPGTAEQVTRTRTYWYAPSLGTWVRWTETMHASRAMAGASFTYDCSYSARLIRRS